MKIFKDFVTYNHYVGLQKPLDNDIDVGYYDPPNMLLSYVNVLVSLVEAFYKRQFSTDPKQYNPIVTDFQQRLAHYYNQPVKQLLNVQYFADELGLTANYLGGIIKHFTQKSALENIHEFVVKKSPRNVGRRSKNEHSGCGL